MTQTLVSAKEEEVMRTRDGSAYVAAKLVTVEKGPVGDGVWWCYVFVRPGVGVEFRVAEVVIQFSVEVLAAVFGDKRDHAFTAAVVLRVIFILNDLLFLHGILDGRDHKPAPVNRGRRRAINEDLGLGGTAAVDAERTRRLIEGLRARGQAALGLRGSGKIKDKIERIPRAVG